MSPSFHYALGAANVGILLGLAEIVPADIPPADAHLKVLVLFRMLLRVAQFLRAEDGELYHAAAVSVEYLHERAHQLKAPVSVADGWMQHHV